VRTCDSPVESSGSILLIITQPHHTLASSKSAKIIAFDHHTAMGGTLVCVKQLEWFKSVAAGKIDECLPDYDLIIAADVVCLLI
jgi:hypothetical protein